ALASATATFTLMWNVGAALGPLITGAAMDAMGASGLPVTLAIMSAAILPLAFGAWRRRTAATVE
ncbi:MAG: MFS transporter, partial [Rhodospirillaceae bacterium]|nr:MFS transporter [Rhodospirillaceae bacterium]